MFYTLRPRRRRPPGPARFRRPRPKAAPAGQDAGSGRRPAGADAAKCSARTAQSLDFAEPARAARVRASTP